VNIKVVLEYDGSAFAGWQLQPHRRTVEAEVRRALSRLPGAEPRLQAAGRTDAGAHALGQVAGFRFSGGVVPAILMIVLATVFGLAVCCISAYTGLAIGDEESVQAFGMIWLFPLTFVSAAFVPIYTMPGWLQAFANNQPVTFVINAMRALALGHQPVAANMLKSIAWLAGIFIVFAPLAVRAYKRAA